MSGDAYEACVGAYDPETGAAKGRLRSDDQAVRFVVVVGGDYVDPNAGRITFTSFYEDWRERQVWVAGTRRAMDLAAGSVAFGKVP